MIPPHYIIVVLLVFIANLLLTQYHRRLFIKTYKQHITLVPKTVTSKRYTRFVYGGIAYVILVATLTVILLYQQTDYLFYQRLFFGSIIGVLISQAAILITQILYYKYIENNPSEVSGSLTLYPGAHKQLAITNLLQMLIPLASIIIATPDPFIYGFAVALVIQITMLSLNLIRIKAIT